MARPKSQGLKYFSLDVTFDEKIEMIEAEFGLEGFGAIIKLWQRIYRDEGYFIHWNRPNHLRFSKHIGLDKDMVQNIINLGIEYELINAEMYQMYNIITSTGIQKRYFQGVRRRTEINLIKEFLLFDLEEIKKLSHNVPFVLHTVNNYEEFCKHNDNRNNKNDYNNSVSANIMHANNNSTNNYNNNHNANINYENANNNGVYEYNTKTPIIENINNDNDNKNNLDTEIQVYGDNNGINEDISTTETPQIKLNKIKLNIEKEKINKKEKESSPVGEGLEAVNFIDSIIFRFQNEFYKSRGREYHLNNIGKDRMAASKLLGWYKTNNPGQSSAEVLDGLQLFFAEAMNVQTKWHYERMSLSHLNSELNIIEGLIQQSTVKEAEVYDESDWGI